jgi:hypothetical protein
MLNDKGNVKKNENSTVSLLVNSPERTRPIEQQLTMPIYQGWSVSATHRPFSFPLVVPENSGKKHAIVRSRGG